MTNTAPQSPEPRDRPAPRQQIDRYCKSYQAGVILAGRMSLHNGDDLALLLEYKSIELLKAMVAEFSSFDPSKYGHLNKGMKRMTLGNIACKKVRDGLVLFGSVEGFATRWMEGYEVSK